MGAFGAKILPTLQYNNLTDSPIWLASIGDTRKKPLNTKIKFYSVEPTLK